MWLKAHRLFLLTTVLVAAPLAGCLGTGEPEPATETGPVDASPELPAGAEPAFESTGDAGFLPDNFSRREQVVAGVSMPPLGQSGVCRGAVNACYRTPFVVDQETHMVATLVWAREANDFDLRLYHNGARLAASEGSSPGGEEEIALELGPGRYELVVVAWVVTQDAFVLTAGFAPPTDPEPSRCTRTSGLAIGPVGIARTDCGTGRTKP